VSIHKALFLRKPYGENFLLKAFFSGQFQELAA